GAMMDGSCAPLTGISCDDDNACTQSDTCKTGMCVGEDPVSCLPPDKCHTQGTCDPATGTCSYLDIICTAPDLCHIPGVCDPGTGTCSDAISIVCPSDPCHKNNSCDPATGACLSLPKPDGTPCDDGDPCKTCYSGVCSGGPAEECSPFL